MLTVAGIPVRVAQGGARQRPNVEIGEIERSFDGTLRSSVRAQKREWEFRTAWMTEAELTTLRAAIGPATFVTCVINGTSVSNCLVRVRDAEYVGLGAVVLRTAVLEVQEQ